MTAKKKDPKGFRNPLRGLTPLGSREVHAPTLDDPTPCKSACKTCGLLANVDRLNELVKRRGEPADVLAIMRECIKPADWKAIIKKQLELAREGNKGAFESLMEYTIGRPAAMETPPADADGVADLFAALIHANRESQDEPAAEPDPRLKNMLPYLPPKETPRYQYDPDED